MPGNLERQKLILDIANLLQTEEYMLEKYMSEV